MEEVKQRIGLVKSVLAAGLVITGQEVFNYLGLALASFA
jgi:hypothetical protein